MQLSYSPPTGSVLNFFGTCNIEPLVSLGSDIGHVARHTLWDCKNRLDIPKRPQESTYSIFAPTLRNLCYSALGTEFFFPRLRSESEGREALSRLVAELSTTLDSVAAEFSGQSKIFVSFLEPTINPLGTLNSYASLCNPRHFARELNREYSSLVDSLGHSTFLDINESVSLAGAAPMQDTLNRNVAHASFLSDWDELFDGNRILKSTGTFETFESNPALVNSIAVKFWQQLNDIISIHRARDPIKLVIVDLDDTLWRGIAAEEEIPNWQRTEGWPSGFVEALLFFKARGGLLAICSKNDASPTLSRISTIWGHAIQADDFCSIKIGWDSKAKAVGEILRDANILPEHTLFIDDNPREVSEVVDAFPSINSFNGDHYGWRRELLLNPRFRVAGITAESANRTTLVKARLERDALGKRLERADWLRTLQLSQEFHIVSSDEDPHFARAFELLNKTNQFNTTGKRWERTELAQLFVNEGVIVVCFLRDKFTDNGLVGCSVIQGNTIVQVVLSCRVFGLDAEIALANFCVSHILKSHNKCFAMFATTPKNHTCSDYFVRCGMERSGTSDPYFVEQTPPIPDHITVSLRE